jgi:hypothetical protein
MSFDVEGRLDFERGPPARALQPCSMNDHHCTACLDNCHLSSELQQDRFRRYSPLGTQRSTAWGIDGFSIGMFEADGSPEMVLNLLPLRDISLQSFILGNARQNPTFRPWNILQLSRGLDLDRGSFCRWIHLRLGFPRGNHMANAKARQKQIPSVSTDP